MNKNVDYKALFETTPIPRFLVRKTAEDNYIVIDANEKAREYFAVETLATLMGQKLESLMDAETYVSLVPSLELALEGEKHVSLKSPSALPGMRGFEGFLVSAGGGGTNCDSCLDVMILPRGSDESSIQRERDDAISLLTSVFDVSEVGIVVTDRHHRVVRINDSFVRIYGWKRDDLIGREFTLLIAPEEREQARRNHEEFMRSGIRSSGEMKLLRKDNTVANALFTTAALELSHGRRFQITTIMDITMRKQMEITLRLAKEQADSANQAKSTFLANMSHELRTPLNAILGFSEMMMKETFGKLGNDKYKEYLSDIHLSARHLLEIINEVLDMSKIEAGKVELDEEYFDVHSLIQAVTRMMDSRAFSSGLKIREDVQENLPPLHADPRLIRQVLINIVGNAVKYSKTGGTIDIQAFLGNKDELKIIVTDTGIGIPKDKIGEAMEPFGQVNKSAHAGGVQGTGLGLPLAKAMVELHGGALELDSEVNKGTVVTITLPASRLVRNKEKTGSASLIAAAIGKGKLAKKAG